MKKILILIIFFLSSSLLFSPIAFAQSEGKMSNPIFPSTLSSLSGVTFLQKALGVGIGLILIGGSIIFFFMLLLGAIRWITSGGDKAGMESARNKVTHALIGLVILFSVFAIIKLMGTIFGVDLLNITLPTL